MILKNNNKGTLVNVSRNYQLRRTRLLPSFMLMLCKFVRRNFIGHHGWNDRGIRINQSAFRIQMASYTCLIGQSSKRETISPSYYPVLAILNSTPCFGRLFHFSLQRSRIPYHSRLGKPVFDIPDLFPVFYTMGTLLTILIYDKSVTLSFNNSYCVMQNNDANVNFRFLILSSNLYD